MLTSLAIVAKSERLFLLLAYITFMDCTVVWWLALLAQSKKVFGSNPGSKNKHVRLIGDSILNRAVSVCGGLSLCWPCGGLVVTCPRSGLPNDPELD